MFEEHIVDWTAGSMFASNCSSSRGGSRFEMDPVLSSLLSLFSLPIDILLIILILLRDTTEVLKSGCNSGREVQWWPRALCSLGVSWILKVAVHQLKLEYSTCSRTSIRGTAAESPCQSDERWWAMMSDELRRARFDSQVWYFDGCLWAKAAKGFQNATCKPQDFAKNLLWSKGQQRYDANLGVPFQCQIAACNCSGQQEACPSRVALQQPVVVVQS